jgi:energy-coupling factor transporter ATP-binding protein EcfA2
VKTSFKYSEERHSRLSKIKIKNREDFLNVFTPASPIQSPSKFVGREQALEDMVGAIISKGADLIVYGERGCGKSSLAYMLHDITQGNFEILDYYGLRDRLEKRGFLSWLIGPERKKFNVIWVNGLGRSFEEVVNAILTRRKERIGDKIFGPGLLSYLPKEADQIEIASKIGFNKIFTSEGQLKEVHIPKQPINIKEGFEIAMQRYADQYDDQLIIILDEFETVTNRGEISFYLKNMLNARFVLVGIAETTFDLMEHHASISRQTHAVKLDVMTTDELSSILDIGSFILRNHLLITDDTIEQIIYHSSGSPYWCHFFAKALIQKQLEKAGNFERFLSLTRSSPLNINEQDFESILQNLPQNAECRLFEEQLQGITLGDELTTRILVYIAKNQNSIISSSLVCQELEKEQNISKKDIIETINGFLEMRNSPFEQKSKIRDIISFSFRDPNFQRYILIRHPMYLN